MKNMVFINVRIHTDFSNCILRYLIIWQEFRISLDLCGRWYMYHTVPFIDWL